MDGERVYKVYTGGVTPTVIDPSKWDDWEPGPEPHEAAEPLRPVTGWLLPPLFASIWAAIFTKMSNNPLLDVAYRVGAVYEHVRNLWNDFCLWSEERSRKPWGKWSFQVGYMEPTENPTWRMKYTIEVKRWKNMNAVFHVNGKNANWYEKCLPRLLR